MQPLRILLTCLGGVTALAGVIIVLHNRSSNRARRPERDLPPPALPPRRNRLAAYYRVSLN